MWDKKITVCDAIWEIIQKFGTQLFEKKQF